VTNTNTWTTERKTDIMEEPINKNERYARIMMTFPLLSGFTVHGTQMLLDAGVVREYSAGEAVCAEGEVSTSTLLILSGKLQAYTEREGARVVFRECAAGTILGEIGVTCDMPRTASVRASESSEVLQWSAAVFRSLLLRSALLAERIHQHSLRSLVEKEHTLIAQGIEPRPRPTL
jgi:CRP-like cAMP-binding protein